MLRERTAGCFRTFQRHSEFDPAVLFVAEMGGTADSGRVMRAHPDVVLSLPVLYSELLAMALSGKELKVNAFGQSAPQAGMTIFGDCLRSAISEPR